MTATRRATLRIGVIGVGRIGSMHADLLERQVPGATVAGVYDADPEAAPRGGGARRASTRSRTCSPPTSTRSRSARRTETHADLIVAAARAGKAIFCEKPISLDLAEVDRALAAVDEAGVPFQIGFNRRFDPAHAGRARRGRARRRRRPAARAHLEPRPGAAADGVRARLGRDLPRHDDPRLRHGALRDRQRGRRGVRARRRAGRPGVRRRRRRRHRARHARARRTAA